ncbi:molybdenum cofactor guanylyltransferase [Paenibacillus kobensis]|uniref:molybdenum cofactor guanylyltransferase n=1 Tax=Paenibacillus kobensis TaxID=59841 RepID=UPI0013E2B862|nr:molybdenum cofactor guanylyltransferase [Paenibacillus kobensis]
MKVTEAIVLAGGRSSRMGRDKALLPVKGQPLLIYLIAKLNGMGMRVTVSAGTPEQASMYRGLITEHLPTSGTGIVEDLFPGEGPLAGLHAALSSLQQPDYAFVLACDMPHVSSSLIGQLESHRAPDAMVVAVQGQPFHALYHTNIVPLLAGRLESGQLRMMEVLREAKAVVIEADDDDTNSAFTNLNTPEAYIAFLEQDQQ